MSSTIYEDQLATTPARDSFRVEPRTPQQMYAVLQRERALSDRSQRSFALIVFETNKSPLARIIAQRIGQGDEIGWLGARRIGVVLPDSSSAAAVELAKQIQQDLAPRDEPPPCCVYGYPTPWRCGEETARRVTTTDPPVLAMESLFVRPISFWKRAMDVVGASVGMVLLLPLFAMVALAIKLSSPGPVLFKQPRRGRGGKRFLMYKFRSMVLDAEQRKPELLPSNEQDGPAFKIQDDPRVTRLGRWLRKSSIDELPQLWNVLQGEMSLVGPRPLPCREMDACCGWLRRRLDLTPGLTCIWQVEARNQVSFEEWVRMDMQYLRRQSLLLDLKILLATVPAVLFCRGAR